MLKTYVELAALAAKRAVRSWLAALAIPLLALVWIEAARLFMPLGMVGGFLLGMVSAACVAIYLSMLGSAVAGSNIRLADFKHGLRAFWDVVSVLFALWIINLGLAFVSSSAGSNQKAIVGVAGLAMAIFFNIVPELIYSSRSRSFALLKESATFVMANPFAWFAPNLLFAAVLLGALGSLSGAAPAEVILSFAAVATPHGFLSVVNAAPLWMAPFLIALFHFVMVFRGLLYQELASGSSRMRAFRRSMGR